MTGYRDQVSAAVEAVRITGPVGYSWLGRRSRPVQHSLLAQMDRSDCQRHLVVCLREELYASFYCAGAAVPARWGDGQPAAADPRLRNALSNANTGHGSWDRGWIVQHCAHDEAVVSTPRIRVRVPLSDCRGDDGRPIGPAAAVSVRLPKELPALSAGFFMVVGDAAFDPSPHRVLVRAYWHVAPTGAPALVHALTSRLNAGNVPFRLKVANHPARFDRCDAAVLYLCGDTFQMLRRMLLEVAASLAAHLRPRIPALTLPLAPGVGLAESAGMGESFGMSRCRLLAQAIVDADEVGIDAPAARLTAVIDHLAENGVAIDAPYREPLVDGRHAL
ncbi:MAG: T3SS effector HopA1 family protein [Solirubrobacteraceae bacterium]